MNINRKDVKDTLSVITLPRVLEQWQIESIANYVMMLLSQQRKGLNASVKEKMIDYCYDFAWHYGRLYHIGDAEKIKAAISEKFRLPEEFLGELLDGGMSIETSETAKIAIQHEEYLEMFLNFLRHFEYRYINHDPNTVGWVRVGVFKPISSKDVIRHFNVVYPNVFKEAQENTNEPKS